MGAGVSLGGLGLIAAGSVLMWSGVNDPEGGPVAVVRDILAGKTPTPGQQSVSDIAVGGRTGGAVGARSGGSLAELVAGNATRGAKVVSVARQYLGVPYRWGGASKSGIDCSGLVLVAYRDGAGIRLPHLATAQAARGKRIDRSQVQPGDLVAWGVPGNYPHIALAISSDQVIVAPTYGQNVQIQKLWEAKVSGFGMPDIYRIP